jgi:hypothetical protein
MSGKKDKVEKNRMILFNQNVEQFVGMKGEVIGPFAAGALANLDMEIANLFVGSGKAAFVDSE